MTASDRLTTALADRYRIEREIGQGGMATVYLAEDLKHKRHVALKVLKPELAAVIGADRFLAEITTTANLQHPHILPLHDSGTVNGTVFYVMPFVEGESLRDRLSREKQLPIADAVRIAREIAGALDYAHRHGVIHRDIKPENILLHDGRAVVADFGIALAASRTDGGNRMTETGMSLGTPHYMSPEQAMGERDLDGRTDVYALGCVLYEMLTGEPPFTGPSAQAIVAKVMGSEPERVTTLRKTVPEYVEDAVLTALEKVPADRFATAGAMSSALDGTGDALSGRSRTTRTTHAANAGAARRHRVLWPIIAVLAAVALWGWLRPAPAVVELPPTRLAMHLPELGSVGAGLQRMIDISPDGNTLIIVSIADAKRRVMRVALDGSGAQLIDGVVSTAADFRVSPDGREFVASDIVSGATYRYPIGGGTPRLLPRSVRAGARMAWVSDGSLLFSDIVNLAGGLSRVSALDSVSKPFGTANVEFQVQQVLPGDRTALGLLMPNGTVSGPVMAMDLKTGATRKILDAQITEVRYAVGFLVYVMSDASLGAVAFDANNLTITGAPVTLATDVTLTGNGQAQFAVADNGTVVFVSEAGRSLVITDRAGVNQRMFEGRSNFHHPRFSPDGKKLAVDFTTADGRDVWVADLADGSMTRATIDRDGHDANWSPDGRSLTYNSFRAGDLGIYRVRPGTAAPAESLFASARLAYSGIWTADGAALVTIASSILPDSKTDIGILRNGGRGPLEPLIASRFDDQYPALSPDNQWLAYTSVLSGREEVYVRAFANDDNQVQVSLNGGSEPVWSRDGKEVYFRESAASGMGGGISLTAATLTTTPALTVISRQPLFSALDIVSANPHTNYDVSPDGHSFAVVRANPSSTVIVIQNLPAMIARLRAVGRGTP
jgi:serine/threonine-protein kinase